MQTLLLCFFRKSLIRVYTLVQSISILWTNRASSRENLSSGFSTRYDSNRPAQLQRLASLEISAIANKGTKLCRQRTTKTLIRQRECAGWSMPLLFAYGINRFSPDVAQYCWDFKIITAIISSFYSNFSFCIGRKREAYELEHDKTNKITCAPSEDSGQLGYLPSLMRVFAVRLMVS